MKGTLFIAQEGNPGVYEPVGDLVDIRLSGGPVEFGFESKGDFRLPPVPLPDWSGEAVVAWVELTVRRHTEFMRAMHRRTGRHMRCSPLHDMRGEYWRCKWAIRSGRERGHWRWFKKG